MRVARNIPFRVFVTAFVVCLIIGQMIKPRIAGVPVTVVDLLIIGSAPLILLLMRARMAVFGAIALFLLPNIVIGVAHQVRGGISSTQLAMGLYSCYRFIFPFLLLFMFMRNIDRGDRAFSLRLLLWGLGFHIMFGLYQAALLPNFALQYGPDDIVWDYQESRLVSTFLDPNLASSLFYMGILAMLYHVTSRGRAATTRTIGMVLAAAMAAILTASRGGALGFAVVFGAFLLENRELSLASKVWWTTLAALTVGILLFAFIGFFGAEFIERTDRFGASNDNVRIRLVNLAASALIFIDAPLFGKGFNFLPYLPDTGFVLATGNYVDGGVLYLLASVGMFGILVLAVILYFASRLFNRPRILLYLSALLVAQSVSTAAMYYPLLTIYAVLIALSLDDGVGRIQERHVLAQQRPVLVG